LHIDLYELEEYHFLMVLTSIDSIDYVLESNSAKNFFLNRLEDGEKTTITEFFINRNQPWPEIVPLNLKGARLALLNIEHLVWNFTISILTVP